MKIVFFDTETTGLPKDRRVPALSAANNWPDIVSLSWMVYENGILVSAESHIVRPDPWTIPKDSTAIHGITNSCGLHNGRSLDWVLETFRTLIHDCDAVVAHNLAFDKNVVDGAWAWHVCPRKGLPHRPPFGWPQKQVCTAEIGKDLCKIPFSDNPRRYKFPSLSALYTHVTGHPVTLPVHSSLHDTMLLASLFFARPLHVWGLSTAPLSQDNAVRPPAPQGTLCIDLSGSDL